MAGLTLRQRLALELNRNIVNDLAQNHPLRQLFWECTLRCNMRCRHCGSDCKVSSHTPDMPFGDFRKVLENIREHYDPHRIMVILTGGEPMMRDDIFDCGRAIAEMEFPWGMVSNGRLMTPEKISRLMECGMRSATVSLDGFEAEHNWMRGTADGFRYASAAVEALAGQPALVSDVVTCANRRNIDTLPQFCDYLLSLGVKRWRIFTVFPVGRAASDPDLQLDGERFRYLMDFISSTRKSRKISLSYGCEGFLGKYEGRVRDRLFMCQAGLSVASVLADGSISSCPSIRADYRQGNIYKDDFIGIWENGFSEYRDRSWMKKGECAECRYFRYCRGNGMHLRDENGNLILCHLKRMEEGSGKSGK